MQSCRRLAHDASEFFCVDFGWWFPDYIYADYNLGLCVGQVDILYLGCHSCLSAGEVGFGMFDVSQPPASNMTCCAPHMQHERFLVNLFTSFACKKYLLHAQSYLNICQSFTDTPMGTRLKPAAIKEDDKLLHPRGQ